MKVEIFDIIYKSNSISFVVGDNSNQNKKYIKERIQSQILILTKSILEET